MAAPVSSGWQPQLAAAEQRVRRISELVAEHERELAQLIQREAARGKATNELPLSGRCNNAASRRVQAAPSLSLFGGGGGGVGSHQEEQEEVPLKLEAITLKVCYEVQREGNEEAQPEGDEVVTLAGSSKGTDLCSLCTEEDHVGAVVCHVDDSRSLKDAGREDCDEARACLEMSHQNTRDSVELPDLWAHWHTEPANVHNVLTRKQRLQQVQPVRSIGDRMLGRGSFLVFNPMSKQKAAWDVLTAIVIIYDLIVFPLSVFGWDELKFSLVLAKLTLGFWTVDLVVSLLSGYYRSDGLVELRLAFVSRTYVRTWFVFDMCIVSIDWFMMIMNSFNMEVLSAARMNKFLRLARAGKVLKITRLVRAFKVAVLYERIVDFCLMPWVVTVLAVVKLLLMFAIVLHYVTCLWYMIGKQDLNVTAWVHAFAGEDFNNFDWYLVAFYWSIAQFTPAPPPAKPENQAERLFTVMVIFFGFAVVSSTIGSLAALITQSRNAASEKMKMEENLRTFLEECNVSQTVGRRITHLLMKGQTRVHMREDRVPSLKGLPPYLLEDLHYEIRSPALKSHPLMKSLDGMEGMVIRAICHQGIEERSYEVGCVVFAPGTEGGGMYCVITGSFRYLLSGDETEKLEVEMDSVEVEKGKYLAEAALWCEWRHSGLLDTVQGGYVLCVAPKTFFLTVKEYTRAYAICHRYAGLFMKRMLAQIEADEAPDDLSEAFSSEHELEDMLWCRGQGPLMKRVNAQVWGTDRVLRAASTVSLASMWANKSA